MMQMGCRESSELRQQTRRSPPMALRRMHEERMAPRAALQLVAAQAGWAACAAAIGLAWCN